MASLLPPSQRLLNFRRPHQLHRKNFNAMAKTKHHKYTPCHALYCNYAHCGCEGNNDSSIRSCVPHTLTLRVGNRQTHRNIPHRFIFSSLVLSLSCNAYKTRSVGREACAAKTVLCTEVIAINMAFRVNTKCGMKLNIEKQ